MRVRFTIFHVGEYDPDNIWASLKPCLDALKNLHLIRDDSAKWIQLEEPVQITVAPIDERTVIELEPVMAEPKAA